MVPSGVSLTGLRFLAIFTYESRLKKILRFIVHSEKFLRPIFGKNN